MLTCQYHPEREAVARCNTVECLVCEFCYELCKEHYHESTKLIEKPDEQTTPM